MKTNVSATQKIEVSIIKSKKEPTEKPILRKSTKKSFIELKKTKFGIRLDLLTKEEFVPLRKTQKFANAENRKRYYNEISNARNFKIISEYKNAKYEDEQNTNWQQIVIYLIDNKNKSFKDKIHHLMNNYSVTNKNK